MTLLTIASRGALRRWPSALRRSLPMLALALYACSDLTTVEAPDVTEPSALDNANGALVLRAGALSAFAQGVGQQAFFSGLMADEFADRNAGTFAADRRVVTQQNDGFYPYLNFSTARIGALTAIQALQRHNPTPAWRIGELFALLGYVEIIFAENLCSGVPLGQVVDGRPAYGPTLSRSEILRESLAHFDSAALYSTANDSIANLVRIGRARALLDSGNFAAAGAAAAGVPPSYRHDVVFGATTLGTNIVFRNLAQLRLATVSNVEGVNGLPFVAANDPRVPTQNLGAGQGGTIHTFLRYTSLTSPIRLASGVEAALIRAEAALRAGDITAWAGLLNTLRQTAITPAMPALTADSTTAASATLRHNVMFRERAFWMYLTGHRIGDLRRLVRQYGRAEESVYPTGAYHKQGLTRGGQAALRVPQPEENNPNYQPAACTQDTP